MSHRSWISPDTSQKFLIWHFKQSSCLKASLAIKRKSCKKVLFSAKFLAAFLIPLPSPQHTFMCPVTCQIQPLPAKSLKGCSSGLCHFCSWVSYQKLLLSFIWLSQGLPEEWQLLVTDRTGASCTQPFQAECAKGWQQVSFPSTFLKPLSFFLFNTAAQILSTVPFYLVLTK